MKMSVICESCGHRHEIDAIHAGRRGKCAGCGTVMTVPTPLRSESEDDESGVYGLDEPPPAPSTVALVRPIEDAPSTFRTAPRSQSLRTNRHNARIKSEEADDSPAIGRIAAMIAGVAVVALLLVALIVPDGVKIAGAAITFIGVLMALVGYGVGAYSAFGEDFLYGILYVFIPLYTAYYIVSRFDDLGRWMGLALIGLVLITIGGVMVGVG